MNKVFYLSLREDTPCKDFWDYGFIQDFFSGNMWQPPNWTGFDEQEVRSLPVADRACVVIPARSHAGLEEQINQQLANINHVVLFLMGDEESVFNVEAINHPSIHIWLQNPRTDKYNRLGTGYPPAKSVLAELDYNKSTDVFFSGQVTHERRKLMMDALLKITGLRMDVNATKGFTQGFSQKEYYKRMSQALVAPAPSGPETPDSFRLFEALEAMAIPIADNQDPKKNFTDFWTWLFPDVPFPTINNYDDLKGYIEDSITDFHARVVKQTTWWIKYKREFAYTIMRQLENSGGQDNNHTAN